VTDIHPQLLNDCFIVGRFPLCTLLLMNVADYPWFILVPDRPDISEIHQLTEDDQQQLMRESSALAAAIERAFEADKINIGALGNLVPQLHIHHIVRHRTDPAWPAPVWGAAEPVPYSDAGREQVIQKLKAGLGNAQGFRYNELPA
jgi:diadenosine tetraphosphate (Ap4A) HIT family hydrolase